MSPPLPQVGTGNDLARSFGWTGSMAISKLPDFLLQVADAEVCDCDRWHIFVLPHAPSFRDVPVLPYLSISKNS